MKMKTSYHMNYIKSRLSVKTTNEIPRSVIIAFQTDKSGNQERKQRNV